MNKTTQRTFQGVVMSDAMDKTIVVKVEVLKNHKVYGKKYRVSKRYKVHDPKNEYHVGEVVNFIETRPISKDKRWKVMSKATPVAGKNV